MQSDIVQKLQPILRRNGWGNVREYARHIPFMLEREGLAIVETAEITRLTEALRAAEEREKGLREAVDRLRSGYDDAKHTELRCALLDAVQSQAATEARLAALKAHADALAGGYRNG